MRKADTDHSSLAGLPDDAFEIIGANLLTQAPLTCSVHQQTADGSLRAYCRPIAAWDAHILVMHPPLVVETGIFYNTKSRDLGLQQGCRRVCIQWDGADIVVNSRGEELRIYHWDSGACAYAEAYDIVENCMKRTNYIFYDAVVEDRLDDLPTGCVAQVHKGHHGLQIRYDDGSQLRLKKFVVVVKEKRPARLQFSEPLLVLSRRELIDTIPTSGSGSYILTREQSSIGLLGASFAYDMIPYEESIHALEAGHFLLRREKRHVRLVRRLHLSKSVVLQSSIQVDDMVALRID